MKDLYKRTIEDEITKYLHTDDVLPIEVKLNFEQFNRSAIDYFCRHYETAKYKIVGLNGQLKDNTYIYSLGCLSL